MCDPVTLTVAATAVAAVGTGVSGYMSYQQQRYQQKVATANAKMESQRAGAAIERGAEEQRNLARKYAGLAGQQRAALAANGVDVGFGSAADMMGDTASFYREDSDTLSRNTAAEIRGIDISAANFSSQAKAYGMAATGAAIGTAFDMGSTVLGGLGRVGKIKADRSGGGRGWGGY